MIGIHIPCTRTLYGHGTGGILIRTPRAEGSREFDNLAVRGQVGRRRAQRDGGPQRSGGRGAEGPEAISPGAPVLSLPENPFWARDIRRAYSNSRQTKRRVRQLGRLRPSWSPAALCRRPQRGERAARIISLRHHSIKHLRRSRTRQLTDRSENVAILDKSGIKRKIIEISACHAGAFIPVFRDSNSINITAAAAEKTSFGCCDDRDLTYFGEAFYRDALPKAGDIRSAFEDAKSTIGLREQQESQALRRFSKSVLSGSPEIDRTDFHE